MVLADDHHFFREGLRGMLAEDGIDVVGEAADGDGAVALAKRLSPDLVLIDLEMPGMSGIEALSQIVDHDAAARVSVLTVSQAEEQMLRALDAGACGYLLKDTRREELVGGIRLLAAGHAVLPHGFVQTLAQRTDRNAAPTKPKIAAGIALSSRELEVIRLIAEGADNATIGLELSISRHTVKQHVTNILEKLAVEGRVQAAVYAVRAGLV